MIAPRIELVVARADNGVIGKDGAMPWHLPADLRQFKVTTMGAPMVMGRKTFESLPGLLPGREHIVLTRDPKWRAKGAKVVHDLEAALTLAAGERVSVIGGAEIFRLFLPMAERIHLTEIHLSPEGDTIFPQLNGQEWSVRRGERQTEDGDRPAHTFVQMTRKAQLSTG